MRVNELIKILETLPQDAEVVMHAPYEDPDEGWVNGGGYIDGARICANPEQWGAFPGTILVEISSDLSVPSKIERY
jgi:hypothetical protein